MSDTLVNIRLGVFHLQLTKSWRIRVSRNEFHRGNPDGRFAIYELFGLERMWR